MIFTTRMIHLTAVALDDQSESITAELLRLGLVHFVDVTEQADKLVTRREPDAQLARSAEARRRIEAILGFGGIGRPAIAATEIGNTTAPDAAAVISVADKLGTQIDRVREKQRTLQGQINRLEDVQRNLPTDSPASAREIAGLGRGGAFLDIQKGSIPLDQRASLEQKLALFPAVMTPLSEHDGRLAIVLASIKRNKSEVDAILASHGFRAEEISDQSGTETRETVAAKLDSLRTEQRALAQTIPDLVQDERTHLEEAWRSMRVQELLSTIRGNFARTRRVVVASGWLPISEKTNVERALFEATGGHIFLEWHQDSEFVRGRKDESEKASRRPAVIPSRLQNPRFLQPFQALVTNFGVPAYGTVDPTGLVAIAYLVMFGLMFGDAGHGLVLVLAGIAGRVWLRKSQLRGGADEAQGGIRSAVPLLSKLMLWCGASAIVAGVLFGSYFGFELFRPLWFDYHGVVAGHVEEGAVQSIFDVLNITIYFGIVVIALGLLINWANLIRQRRWFPLIFDKAGIMGGTMYGAGVVMAASFASSGFRSVPSDPFLTVLIVLPSIILFFKGPLEGHTRNPLWWVMEWVIELLEVFSGYLANTLSFMRVAGLGIAHVTLMIAFFQIAKMASPVGLSPVGILILVLGNVLVIVLEGLSAGIQSLRLNYYEFFSKHFQPSGVAYKPVSLEVS